MKKTIRSPLILGDFLLYFVCSFLFYREYVDWDRPWLALLLPVVTSLLFGGQFLLLRLACDENLLQNKKKTALFLCLPAAFHLFVTYLFLVTVNGGGSHASDAVQGGFHLPLPLFFVLSLCATVFGRKTERKPLWIAVFALQILLFTLIFSFGILLHDNGYARDIRSANFDHYRDNVVLYDVKYGKDKRQRLDLFIPKDAGETCGLVLYIHGGGWIAGNKDCYWATLAETTAKGYVAAALNYHYLDDDHSLDNILSDITLALSEIREICAERGVSLSKVLLTGSSAGGHLSLQYGYRMADVSLVPIGCIVSFCGPADLTDEGYYHDNLLGTPERVCDLFSDLCGEKITPDTRASSADALLTASPITYVTERSVPTVICHGMVDNVVPYQNALDLDQKLTDCGVEHLLIPYPHSGHGLDQDPDASAAAETALWDYAERFLR